jgi:hypothetical protein
MQTIFELKEQAVTDTPLLVFDCVLPDGRTEKWSTHRVTAGGAIYEARVLQHNVFEVQTASDQGVDGIPRISILLANADSHFSEIERAGGWKGARLKVGFLFYDLRNDAPLTDTSILFQGICNPPDEIREATFRITATNRMNLQRLLLPQVRIQRRCPWEFPATEARQMEAVDGGESGKYSGYYRCGYSAGATGGLGSLSGGSPYTVCGYTRSDCQARGMFSHFGGIEFVPPAISVRTYGDKSWHTSAVAVNGTRYNDFVPLVYGTAWYTAPVVFARNDGNLTRMEVLLGIGEMQGVLKVLVNGVEIPAGISGANMTGTGWYNIPTLGTRAGTCNPDFMDGSGQAAGDPYGSMAYLSVVVPNRLNDGSSLPAVKVLAQGLRLPVYGADGTAMGEQFSSNPAWILLDILRRAGWKPSEIDIPSFAAAAAYCDEAIAALDLYGNAISLPRFQCNVMLQNRRSAGDLVRGVRNTARLLLSYGADGALHVRVENTAAAEQPSKPQWSNSNEELNGGWPGYEFGDGSNGFSGILRRQNGEPSVRVYSRSMADTPNRFTVEFQDALNEYQQDSFSLVDPDDVARSGQEVSTTLSAIGIPNYDQASRILKVNLDKSVRGNSYIEFDTSVKSFGVRPGDLITVTYLKEGFNRQAFRILKIAPGINHRVTTITAQLHDDSWYADSNGQVTSAPGGRRQGSAGIGVPKPLMGSVVDANGDVQFGVEESATTSSDGAVEASVTASFIAPAMAGQAGPGIPMLSLATQVGAGGSLQGGQTLYYAVSGADGSGNESGLSFIVRATTASDGSSVTLTALSFAPGTSVFQVYRGSTPAELYRIATDQAPAAEFQDTGLANQLIAPPDPNFDHANFYWRMELQPESAVATHSSNSVGNGVLSMAANRYRGMIARITRGRGAGQERAISANTATVVTVSRPWVVEPDATSFFTVAENSWRFGALSKTSPVQFTIPNRSGEVVQLSGRAANVNDVECAAEISTITRWQIGGSGVGGGDGGIPPTPFFGLRASPGGGMVELSGVSFTDLTNTRSISSATLNLYYWDELQGTPDTTLANDIGAGDLALDLSSSGPAVAGSYIQIEAEVIRVEEVQINGARLRVTRGAHGTTAAAHTAQTLAYSLSNQTAIAPFPHDFFGSPYSGSWTYSVPLPDVRVASAELFVTNSIGNSPTGSIYLTHNDDQGLRTLSGGQYSIQVDGYLAVDSSAAPALVVEGSHAVRDVFAILGKAADAPVQLQLNVDGAAYCVLTFAPGTIVSNSADGLTLPPLTSKAKITLSVLSVGQNNPGADLTVLIRL